MVPLHLPCGIHIGTGDALRSFYALEWVPGGLLAASLVRTVLRSNSSAVAGIETTYVVLPWAVLEEGFTVFRTEEDYKTLEVLRYRAEQIPER